jgi:hypothetical protein
MSKTTTSKPPANPTSQMNSGRPAIRPITKTRAQA